MTLLQLIPEQVGFGLCDCLHPLGQVVKILSVPIPFETLIKGIIGPSFIEFPADSEPARSRVILALLITEATYPPAP